jgi:8-hydroxy-5-deazaflavin:NADPH oxidoreductase
MWHMKHCAVLGSGEVGQTLSKGLKKHGYEVRIGSRTPAKLGDFSKSTGIPAGTFEEISAWADTLVLAVSGTGAMAALGQVGRPNLKGKLVMDATNPISDEPPQDGVLKYFTTPTSSLMEQLQAAYPDARFVKVFNSVGSDLMVNPVLKGGKPTMFYCGNDPAAKAEVAKLLDQFGWEKEDMGTAVGARAVEALAQIWCIPGFLRNDWTHAFRLMRP